MKSSLRILLLAVAFMAASATTYLAIHKWSVVKPASAGEKQQDTIAGVPGLREGEIITFPEVTTLTGARVSLANVKEERLLCVFISSRCAGCTRDAELWKDLNVTARTRDVAFYLIDVGDDATEVGKLSSAYNLQDLPILVDPAKRIGKSLRVEFVPQYLLVTRGGQVLHRWDGIQHYDRTNGSEQLARYFEPHREN
jgi:peroxiredoxin